MMGSLYVHQVLCALLPHKQAIISFSFFSSSSGKKKFKYDTSPVRKLHKNQNIDLRIFLQSLNFLPPPPQTIQKCKKN